MALLKIIKLSTKTWKHNSDVDGDFILTKFYAKQEDNEFLLVETYGAKRRKYLISEIEVYDIGGTAETFSNFTDLFLRLEALKYPAFYVDGESTGGGTWGTITGTLADQTDLQSALNSKQDVLTPVNFGEFMDLELPTKLTPSLSDSLLARDSLTNEAVEVTITDLQTLIGGNSTTEDNMHKEWCGVQARYDLGGVFTTNMAVLVSSGTQSIVSRTGTSLYSSLSLQNYVTSTATGQNAGLKENNVSHGYIRQGFDAFFMFANNSTDNQHMTTVGFYSLFSAIPNLAISSFTGDFFGVGNDVGDTNLSFYSHRVSFGGQTASYTKVATNSSFPAHTTTDAYLLRMEAPQTETESDRYIKMTLTNIVTGATIEHTFPYTETPILSRVLLPVINRNNRNSGTSTNIRFGKYNLVKKSY